MLIFPFVLFLNVLNSLLRSEIEFFLIVSKFIFSLIMYLSYFFFSFSKKLFLLSNVEVLWDTVVEEIGGTEQVEYIRLFNKKTGLQQELTTDGVFVAVGTRPVSKIFTSLVETDENGYLVAGEECATNIEGIFAAGDVRTKKLRQIVTAVADGANAISGIQDYLWRSTN